MNEVVSELASEGTMGTPSTRGELAPSSMALDVDVSRLSLDAGAADAISQHLDNLAGTQQGDRIQRLERSLMRVEQINLETLDALKKLVNAVRKPPGGDAS